MRFHSFAIQISALFLLSIGACGQSSTDDVADLVLSGGHIVTMDEGQPMVQAVAVRGDRIVAVGTDEAIQKWVGGDTTTIALDGKTVVPVMIDAHEHFNGIGARRMNIDDSQSTTKEDIVQKVD